MTNLPIKQVLQKADISGRLVKWAIELSEYNIQYDARGPIKAQVLSNLLVEVTNPPMDSNHEDVSQRVLSVNGASNLKGSGAGAWRG